MKIAVIGGGVSGVTFAINRKRSHPEDEILIFEHSDKLLKKVLATGNGKCNIANAGDIANIYNSPFAASIISKYDFEHQNNFLSSINIKTKLVNNLSYPISESAVTVRNAYIKAVEKLKIQVYTNTNIVDYLHVNDRYMLKTDNGQFEVDAIVFACGGKSSPKLGSDGSIINLLEKHHYKIKEFEPALCPIYTKEKTKILDGTRVKAKVNLLNEDKIIFEECGEVLFKDHGLSGIVIFNASRVIAQNPNKKYVIKIDLLPEITNEELLDFYNKHGKETLLETFLHPNLAKYLMNIDEEIIKLVKSLKFTFDKLYGFDNSQISVGGIELSEINSNLESKKEDKVFFSGELLNIDAPCGGYNLMWAIGSALHLSDNI